MCVKFPIFQRFRLSDKKIYQLHKGVNKFNIYSQPIKSSTILNLSQQKTANSPQKSNPWTLDHMAYEFENHHWGQNLNLPLIPGKTF